MSSGARMMCPACRGTLRFAMRDCHTGNLSASVTSTETVPSGCCRANGAFRAHPTAVTAWQTGGRMSGRALLRFGLGVCTCKTAAGSPAIGRIKARCAILAAGSTLTVFPLARWHAALMMSFQKAGLLMRYLRLFSGPPPKQMCCGLSIIFSISAPIDGVSRVTGGTCCAGPK